jgi:hypothetical protein
MELSIYKLQALSELLLIKEAGREPDLSAETLNGISIMIFDIAKDLQNDMDAADLRTRKQRLRETKRELKKLKAKNRLPR